MKIFRSHDSIALIVLFIIVLSAIIMKNIVISNSVQHHSESYIEYTDIDVQTISIFR